MNYKQIPIIIQNLIFEYRFKRVLTDLIKNDFDPNKYKYFATEQGIDEWASDYNAYFHQKIIAKNNLKANDDLKELETFSFYSGYTGEQINDLLRGKSYRLDYNILIEYVERIDKAISKFSLQENQVAIRRLSCNYLNSSLKKGSIFLDKGFLSTSLNLSYRLDNEGNVSPLCNEALIIIKIPKVTNSIYIKEISGRDEYELLLQRDTRLQIERNINVFNNRIIVAYVAQAN